MSRDRVRDPWETEARETDRRLGSVTIRVLSNSPRSVENVIVPVDKAWREGRTTGGTE